MFCTTQAITELPPWIAYADKGKGIALEVNLDPARINTRGIVLPVCYDDEIFTSVLSGILPKLNEICAELEGVEESNEDQTKVMQMSRPSPLEVLARTLTILAASIKSSIYQYESERRLIYWAGSDVLMADSDLRSPNPKRFFSVPMNGKYFLRSVTVGPCSPIGLEGAVESFLQHRGLNVPVHRSRLEYRGVGSVSV